MQTSDSKKGGGLEIDFTFNTIKNVKKVPWKSEAPWFREIHDGFCWLAYCNNSNLSEDMLIKAEMRNQLGPQGTTSMSINEFKTQSSFDTQSQYSPETGSYMCPAFK